MVEIILLIILGLTGGILLGINRALIGRLGSDMGAASASVINHLGGLLFILLIIVINNEWFTMDHYLKAPWYAYLGGMVGALFVALVGWIIPRIGVMKTSLLLISGQMIFSAAIDLATGKLSSWSSALLGLILIMAGVFLGEYRKLSAGTQK